MLRTDDNRVINLKLSHFIFILLYALKNSAGTMIFSSFLRKRNPINI